MHIMDWSSDVCSSDLPLLAAAACSDEALGVDLERALVDVLELGRDAVDLLHAAVEVLEVVRHHLVPQAMALEIVDEVFVDDGELAGQVRFDVKVLVRRLETGRTSCMTRGVQKVYNTRGGVSEKK